MKKQLKTNYKIGGMLLVSLLLTLMFPISCNASLQSRSNVTSLTNKTASEFFRLCREMETSSGPMGLNAIITTDETTGKVEETSTSNGIDVHMIKNTEYGAAALLSASAYGNCPSGSSSSSTTQNKSGIMQMAGGQWEYVAGILKTELITSTNAKNNYLKSIIASDDKYKDVYDSTTMSETSYKSGDATYETQKWRGASRAHWLSAFDPVFYRSYYGVFYFVSSVGNADSNLGSRAAVVCGVGLLYKRRILCIFWFRGD